MTALGKTMWIVMVIGLAAGHVAAQSNPEGPPNVPPSSLAPVTDEPTAVADGEKGAARSETLDPDALIAGDVSQALEAAGFSTALGSAVGVAVVTAVIAVVLIGLGGDSRTPAFSGHSARAPLPGHNPGRRRGVSQR